MSALPAAPPSDGRSILVENVSAYLRYRQLYPALRPLFPG